MKDVKPQPAPLEERLRVLEGQVCAMAEEMSQSQETRKLLFGDLQLAEAKHITLYSMVMDLAEHEGVSTEKSLAHYNTRLQFWQDHFLRKIEESSPELAAEIDDRTIDECNTEKSYPSIFEEPLD
jgi:hypothetical protein